MNGLDTSLMVTYRKPSDARLGALAAEVIDAEPDLAVGLVGLYTFDRRFPRDGVPVRLLRPDTPALSDP